MYFNLKNCFTHVISNTCLSGKKPAELFSNRKKNTQKNIKNVIL